MPDSRRVYGLGDPQEYVKGVPRVRNKILGGPPCPCCGCKSLYDIEVDVECPMLTTGKGVGVYVGCPACPFASPMVMVATP